MQTLKRLRTRAIQDRDTFRTYLVSKDDEESMRKARNALYSAIYRTGKMREILEMEDPDSGVFEKYSIENLSKDSIKEGKLDVKRSLKEEEKFTSYLFEFEFDPDLDGKADKTTTGQINIPKSNNQEFTSSVPANKFPLIIMLRGYINQETYRTGDGTSNASKFFAENGFITIAPDFLGYGGSSEEAGNIFETPYGFRYL